jgi:CDK inhibitor PHO81
VSHSIFSKKYVEINATGFRKILKKWDKRAKSSTKELYLSRQIEIQPCFNNDVLAEFTDAATTNLAELEAALEGGEYQVVIANDVASPKEYSAALRSSTDGMQDLENALVGFLMNGNTELARDFLEKRKSSNLQHEDSEFSSRIFLQVCAEASIECLHMLADTSDVNLNFTDDITSRTCLHEASITGRLDVLKLAINKGANVDATDLYGRKPLHYAGMYGKDECVMFMLSVSSSIDSVDVDGFTPLTYSIVGGHTRCVDMFLSHGANVEPASEFIHNPLSLASEYGHLEITTLLLSKGARMTANTDGLTPLHLATKEGHVDIGKLLISHGANVNEPDHLNNWTPIFYAASEGHLDCVKILLSAGSDIRLKDETGWLPWTYALYRGHISVANLLEISDFSSADATAKTEPEKKPVDGIQPMAPSGLFGDIMDLDAEDIGDLPSLSLPPPIIPFRI